MRSGGHDLTYDVKKYITALLRYSHAIHPFKVYSTEVFNVLTVLMQLSPPCNPGTFPSPIPLSGHLPCPLPTPTTSVSLSEHFVEV